MVAEIFYTLFIWPIRFVLESLFVLFNRIFDAPGPAVIFLGVVVNTLTLPIYAIAERWRKEERSLQQRMKKKLADIRQVFMGDERQMIINTYYRQMGYSPVFVVKASVGLLLQIPFFIAAYQFLSRASMLSGASFLFLSNLSQSDALLALPFGGRLNLMPFLMTVFNLLASLIYAKDMGKRELVQLFAMALGFLVLLYNSPSGLVLYWTVNNLYSLIKNAAAAVLKKPAKALHIVLAVSAVVFLFFIWSGRAKVERYRVLFSVIAAAFIAVPFMWKALIKMFAKQAEMKELFFSSITLLFLLAGALSPAQVLSASLADFEQPWAFMGRTALQGFAFLVLVPLFVRAFAPSELRKLLAAFFAFLSILCLICYFALSKSYGVMDRNFKLDDTDRLLHAFPLWVNCAAVLAALACLAVFLRLGKDKILASIFGAGAAALILLSAVNLFSAARQAGELEQLRAGEGESSPADIVFPFSSMGTNTFVFFLDRAQGSAMSKALEYMPSLKKELDGFTFYPNTLSFGNCTVIGVPAMLGGYEYMPLEINRKKDELLAAKVNAALKTLPELFGRAGHRVVITDPVIANMQSVPDISIFEGMENVTARNLSGKFSGVFRAEFPDLSERKIDSFDFDILFRYSLFRAALPLLRYGIHYKGQWWKESAYNSYGRAVTEFSSLYYLPQICGIDDGEGTLNIFMNATTHELGSYRRELFPRPAPARFSAEELERFGSEANADAVYTLLSALRQFVKWLDFLKDKSVYDNTRIIVVSDHGGFYRGGFEEMEFFNPLLMVKEPRERGRLRISREFMTHSDTPALAAKTLVEENSAEALEFIEKQETAKQGKLFAVSVVSTQTLRHGPYLFNLTGIRELTGRQVLEKESWGNWEKTD
jgi:YidC/Oxa1 family membrane protein insertase